MKFNSRLAQRAASIAVNAIASAKRFGRKQGPAILIGGATAAPLLSHAVDPVDFTSLTTGIAFTGVVTGILAVAAVKVLPLVAAWGGRKILAMVGR